MEHRRVLIYGVTGSGKTSLAMRTAEVLGVPGHSMDDEVGWLPDWTERPTEDQRRLVAEIVADDEWVLDTSYGRWLDLVLPRTQLIVALDYPRWVSLGRLIRRTVRRITTGETSCNGNTESWRQQLSRDSIVLWHFRSFTRKRTRIGTWESDPDMPPVVRLRSPAETERWMVSLRR